MYDPINNQRFWILQLWWTGWRNKWFRGTDWPEELVGKIFRGTGWCHKWFQGTGWRRKQSKQQSKGIYLHYQPKFYTKNIDKPVRPKDHPSCNPSGWPACPGRSASNTRDFGIAPDIDPEGERHGRSVQGHTHFPDSKGGKPDGQGRLHAKKYQHRCNNRRVDSPNSKFQ